MTPKFKIGDRVVRISTESLHRVNSDYYDEGDVFTITEIAPWGVIWGDKQYGVDPEELEHESVYNSKLYNTIK